MLSPPIPDPKIFFGEDEVQVLRQNGFSGPTDANWATGLPTGALGAAWALTALEYGHSMVPWDEQEGVHLSVLQIEVP